ISVAPGLYRDKPFALVFQVPGLALFLTTYDATKHGLAQAANSANLHLFQLHDVETHLVSGFIAKAVGNIVWAPMNRLQSLAHHPNHGQVHLSLKDAFQLTKHICSSEGMASMWSGYAKGLTTLLPYTMIYFATYEHFKQVARKIVATSGKTSDGEMQQDAYLQRLQNGMFSILDRNTGLYDSVGLSLETYMACVSSAVFVSSTVCQTATVIRDRLGEKQQMACSTVTSASKRPPILSKMLQTIGSMSLRPEPLSPLSSPTSFASSLSAASSAISVSAAGANNGFRHHPLMSAQFRTLLSNTSAAVASHAMTGLPWQQTQHATLTTTSGTSGLLPFQTSMKGHMCHPARGAGGYHRAIVSPMLTSMTPGRGNILQQQYRPKQQPALAARFSSHNLISRPMGALTHNHPLMTTHKTFESSSTNANANANAKLPMTMTMTFNDLHDTTRTANAHIQKTQQTKHQPQQPGLIRTIARGLGPRIMWTVPGVALTTAGFEVLRNMGSA
ncbi:hypothetical protein BGZ94_005485, partial [Podila epigama]